MNKDAYAKYNILPNLSYNILEYLIQEPRANMIWKLLKYNDTEAWNKPDLTLDEKRLLIYPGGEHAEDYNIFLDFVMDDAVNKERTYLRIYPAQVYPQNRTVGICAICFEVFSHSKINHLSNYTTRGDTIIATLLEVLNGQDIGTVGSLYFDAERSSMTDIALLGAKPFKGKVLTMAVNIG